MYSSVSKQNAAFRNQRNLFPSAWLRGLAAGLWVALLSWGSAPALATVTLSGSGLSSVGTPVSFSADFSISGNTLTLVLSNTSPTASRAPNDTLGSFFWDILGPGDTRPTLTLSSVIGDVYVGNKNNPDPLQTAQANLKAVTSGLGWVFRGDLNPALQPLFRFGVGAVGNNGLSPNNFNGNLVGGVDYSIYSGDVATQNLQGKALVKSTLTFTFTGVSGYTENDIVRSGAFGLGTAPDSLMRITPVPEPHSLAAIGLGGLFFWLLRRRS